MSWYLSLPSADTEVPCGAGLHTVRWEGGQLSLPAHPDAEAELVLGALGGDKPGCVTLAETWARHVSDLAVLTAGPRSTSDRVAVSWDQVDRQRASWIGPGQAGGFGLARRTGRAGPPGGPAPPQPSPAGPGTHRSGPITSRVPGVPPTPPAPGAQPRPHAQGPQPNPRAIAAVRRAVAGPGALSFGGRMPEEFARRALQRFEVLELLALGTAFQFRLSGTVAAAWSQASRADERARHRPELTAALTGRFAPAAEEWLGIDPDKVTVAPYEGPGWGNLEVAGEGPDRRLRAALPVSWLSAVWACGLAVAGGHLVVAVEQPGYPRARVLALRAPDAPPAPLEVEASPDAPDGVPRWSPAG